MGREEDTATWALEIELTRWKVMMRRMKHSHVKLHPREKFMRNFESRSDILFYRPRFSYRHSSFCDFHKTISQPTEPLRKMLRKYCINVVRINRQGDKILSTLRGKCQMICNSFLWAVLHILGHLMYEVLKDFICDLMQNCLRYCK